MTITTIEDEIRSAHDKNAQRLILALSAVVDALARQHPVNEDLHQDVIDALNALDDL